MAGAAWARQLSVLPWHLPSSPRPSLARMSGQLQSHSWPPQQWEPWVTCLLSSSSNRQRLSLRRGCSACWTGPSGRSWAGGPPRGPHRWRWRLQRQPSWITCCGTDWPPLLPPALLHALWMPSLTPSQEARRHGGCGRAKGRLPSSASCPTLHSSHCSWREARRPCRPPPRVPRCPSRLCFHWWNAIGIHPRRRMTNHVPGWRLHNWQQHWWPPTPAPAQTPWLLQRLKRLADRRCRLCHCCWRRTAPLSVSQIPPCWLHSAPSTV
mmetsp:Transcript_21145/g.63623  ORF Transcript_21145/g.63623 Transcript_21145/m.63623 type:complete len:266 (+) Transcript_21145:593-1390(+)